MSKSKFFREDRMAMRISARYGLTAEYKEARRHNLTPIEALEEWDMPSNLEDEKSTLANAYGLGNCKL